MPPARSPWLGALIVAVAASLFGSLGVLSRFAYEQGMEPFAFVTWRAGVGALGLWLAVALVRGPRHLVGDLRGMDARTARWLGLGVALAAGVNLAAFLSFDTTTVALALLGFYTYPAMVTAGAVLLGRERLDAVRGIALAMALAGMVAVVVGGPTDESSERAGLLGVGIALVAAAFQTAWVLTSRNYARVSADQAMGAILAGSALVALVITLVVHGPGALGMPLGSPGLVALLVLTGLFAAALPSVLFLTGIRWIGSVRAGIVMLIEPVVGVLLAALLLAEAVQPLQVLGGATILLAAVLVQRGTAGDAEAPAVAPAPGGP